MVAGWSTYLWKTQVSPVWQSSCSAASCCFMVLEKLRLRWLEGDGHAVSLLEKLLTSEALQNHFNNIRHNMVEIFLHVPVRNQPENLWWDSPSTKMDECHLIWTFEMYSMYSKNDFLHGISSYLSEYVCHFCGRNSGPLSDLNSERESCYSPNINVFVRGSPANAYSFATWNAVYIDCFVWPNWVPTH